MKTKEQKFKHLSENQLSEYKAMEEMINLNDFSHCSDLFKEAGINPIDDNGLREYIYEALHRKNKKGAQYISFKDAMIPDRLGIQKIKNASMFRGQEDKGYNLLPSIYRHYRGNFYFDKDIIEKYYESKQLFDLYKNAFGNNSKLSFAFLAFMQHSGNSSPFLDFSYDFSVAESFAVGPRLVKNLGEENKNIEVDGAIYRFDMKKEGREPKNEKFKTLIKNYMVFITDHPIILGEDIVFSPAIEFGNKEKKTLSFKTMKDITNWLIPDVAVLKDETNDRMKFQRGVFLFPYHGLFVNGSCFYRLCDGIENSYRYVLDKNKKDEVITKLRGSLKNKKGESKYSLLMAPYEYFLDL